MSLVDPGTLKAFLARHGVAANKSLGQHFLCSRTVVDAIVASTDGLPGLLEIGPGPGVLTQPLSQHADRMIAVELDPRFVSALAESAPAADVRQADALKASLPEILSELPTPRGVVSNLPYYITGPLITRIAEASAHWDKAVLMMQKEVAEKVLAPVGNRGRGSLSVYLQSQFTIRRVVEAPARFFVPPPKVDSLVLALEPLRVSYTPFFFALVRLAFAQPRKTLANNLVAGLHISRDDATAALEAAGLSELARPQDLTVAQFVALSEWLAEHDHAIV